jgi:hypothetical protein
VVKKRDIKPGVVADEKDMLVPGDAMVEINYLGDGLQLSVEAELIPASDREPVDRNCT